MWPVKYVSQDNMTYLLLIFKTVSLISATAFCITGLRGLTDPVAHSRFFGIPINTSTSTSGKATDQQSWNAETYVSLKGVRQLSQGLTLFAFAYQGNWDAVATILGVLGVVVACTDGYFIATRAGDVGKGVFHAGPGLGIAGLSLAVLVRS
jgi:hypothetical protein